MSGRELYKLFFAVNESKENSGCKRQIKLTCGYCWAHFNEKLNNKCISDSIPSGMTRHVLFSLPISDRFFLESLIIVFLSTI